MAGGPALMIPAGAIGSPTVLTIEETTDAAPALPRVAGMVMLRTLAGSIDRPSRPRW